MKKLLAVLAMTTIVASNSFAIVGGTITRSIDEDKRTITSTSNNRLKVLIDDQYIDFTESNGEVAEPEIKNSRTMVPLRKVLEKLNATINWNATTKEITISKDTTTIVLTIGKTTAIVTKNGTTTTETLDFAPYINGSRTMIPLRYVSEVLECTVGWDATSKTAIIVDTKKIKDETKNGLVNYKELVEKIKIRDESYFSANLSVNINGKGEEYDNFVKSFNNKFNLRLISNTDGIYVQGLDSIFKMTSGTTSTNSNDLSGTKSTSLSSAALNTVMSNVFAFIPNDMISDTKEEMGTTDFMDILEDNEVIDANTYKRAIARAKLIKEMYNDDNIKAVKNGNTVIYSVNIPKAYFDLNKDDIKQIGNVQAKLKVVDGYLTNMTFTVKAINDESTLNDYANAIIVGEASFSTTPYTLPTNATIVPIETYLMAIMFAGMSVSQ